MQMFIALAHCVNNLTAVEGAWK